MFTYNTTENDPRLLDMSVEELLVLFQMHRLKNTPELAESTGDPAAEYENWLKTEMGEGYLTDEQMSEGMEKEEKAFQKRVRERFPDRISTDFSQFKE